jgi:hypothetical protein
MPVVEVLPAPLSCTMRELCVSFFGRCRLTALIVAPQATPRVMFESMYGVRIRAALSATRSRRSMSLVASGTGTTCTAMPNRFVTSCSRAETRSSGETTRISTSPCSRAYPSIRDTDERDVRSSRAIASIVRSCR